MMARPDRTDNSPAADDETLVRKAQANPGAFEELYRRYLDRVYAYVRARASSEADAADLTQQIFVRALEALPGYRGAGSGFAAWLFRIARNTVVDAHRRRRPTVSWDHILEGMYPSAEGGPEASVIRQEALARLRTLVDRLNEDSQELLALRFAARLTVAEIAPIVGKSEAATQRQLHRVIHRLKEEYHDETR